MFNHYSAAVLADYRQKLNERLLSNNLTSPTAARIKDECILKLEKNKDFEFEDEKALIYFTRELSENADYQKKENGPALKRHDYIKRLSTVVDKFKPVVNFLKGNSKNPDDMVIELLAWLIDFKPRPYSNYLSLPADEKKTDTGLATAISEISPVAQTPAEPENLIQQPIASKQVVRKTKLKYALILAIIGIVAATILIINKIAGIGETTDVLARGCMYWAQDRYIPIACDTKGNYPGKTALNDSTLKNFIRIIDISNITAAAVGKLWYIENDGALQLYTKPGFDPLDNSRKLKPLTKEIYEKYWRQKLPLPNEQAKDKDAALIQSPQTNTKPTDEDEDKKANFFMPQLKTYTRRLYDPIVDEVYNAPALLLYLESIGSQGMLAAVKDRTGKRYPFKLEVLVNERYDTYKEIKKFDQGQSVRISVFHPNAYDVLETLSLDLIFIDRDGRKYKQRITPTADSEKNWTTDNISEPQKIN